MIELTDWSIRQSTSSYSKILGVQRYVDLCCGDPHFTVQIAECTVQLATPFLNCLQIQSLDTLLEVLDLVEQRAQRAGMSLALTAQSALVAVVSFALKEVRF